MRVLVTGAGGQLGTDIVSAAERRPDIDLLAFERSSLDVTDGSATQRIILAAKPDIIVHAAAFTAVDLCESEVEKAEMVNATGTANVVRAASESGARVIYISTDYVFDGTKPDPYVESDAANPASVYGRTKQLGEEAVRGLGEDGLIVRTSWVCGRYGANMVKTILRLAGTHDTLTFVDDQIGKPTFTDDLAETLLLLAGRRDSGVMHVTNEGAVSWYEFCRDVLRFAGADPNRVRPCATHELDPPRPAPRPANSVLANTRFGELGLPLLRHYQEPLEETVRDLTK